MAIDTDQFSAAIARFDAANAQDPRDRAGAATPSELLYAQRMTRWLEAMYPGASEPLRLAARAQHLRRWVIPRDQYPLDRAGYHRWRTALAAFHASEAGRILQEVGYDPSVVARVGSLLRKERLKADPEAQALEDVACLVFLEYEFTDFAAKHAEDKVLNILRRTWAKMSPVGHAAALKLELPAEARKLVEIALGL